MTNFIKQGVAMAALAAIMITGATVPAAAKAPLLTKPRAPMAFLGHDGHPDFSGIWQTLSEADYDLEPHAGRRDAPPSQG